MKNSLEGIHKSIYQYLKDKAQGLEGKPSAQLLTYQKDQHKSSKRNFSESTIKELNDSIEDSDIIYLGDFHTFDQSTRNLERLIRILTTKKYEFAIALEFVHIKHQKFINFFLRGHITELEFLESINYKESWRFPWTYYRKFFEIARDNSIPIIALNTEGSLKSRDHKAAQVISKFHKDNLGKKILVLFGEYHIVNNKLPDRVLKATNKSVIQTIVHQNLDEVYWNLYKSGRLKKDKIVKFNKREYALVTSAPWLKYESQIYWYEHLSEDPEFDIHEYIIETGALNFSDNVPDNFAYICEEFIKAYKIKIKKDEIDDFHLYDHIKLDQVTTKLHNLKDTRLENFFNRLIRRGRSFKLAKNNSYFCPNYSINRVSYLAGIHIHHLKLKQQKFNQFKFLKDNDREAIFVYYLFQCMSGYFSSKLINPYRKCDLYGDYKKTIRSKKTKPQKKALYKVGLKLTDSDSPINEHIKGIHLLGIYNLGRMLGHMYADILFEQFFVQEKGEFKEALKIVYGHDFSNKSFNYLKELIFKDLDYKNLHKRMF